MDTSGRERMRLQGKVVLITGAASGIGLAAAQVCGEEGAALALADLPSAPGLAGLSALSGTVSPPLVVPTDVTDADACLALAATAERRWGRVDALIHAAGILQGAAEPVDGLDPTTFRHVIDVNLIGSFQMVRAVVSPMRRAGHGTIVLLASGAGVTGGSSSVAYAASKGGVHGLSLVLQDQLRPAGIRVHDVCPGSVDTPLKRQNVADMARVTGQSVEEALATAKLVDPRGVARLLAFLVSDDADLVRGTVFTR
jgi:NAD(P)-dependent dehydrogenase (short-subunit alcohol dehydrogenase family)